MPRTAPEPVETPVSRAWLGASLGAALAVSGMLACAPNIDNSGCSQDVDCDGRAEVCDIANSVCVPKEIDTTSTENPAPASFSGVVPFHRGQVCMVHDVKSGEDVPITVNPCFHPCLEKGAHEFKHYYSCVGSLCEAWAVMFVNATSIPEGCPPDAFGAFDRALCSMGPSVNVKIGTTIDSGPVIGTMSFEIPFLTNADAAAISAAGNTTDIIIEKFEQYPVDDNRVPGGKDIKLNPNNPAPPASCETGCTCYDIGF